MLNPPFNQHCELKMFRSTTRAAALPMRSRPVALNALQPNFQAADGCSPGASRCRRNCRGSFLAQVGYVGTRGTNWEVWIDRNAPDFAGRPPGLNFDPRLNARVQCNLLRPFVGYGSITQFNSGLTSTYHSLQTCVQRRFASGLALQGGLYVEQGLGEAQTRRDMRVQNPLNWRGRSRPRRLRSYARVQHELYLRAAVLSRGTQNFLGPGVRQLGTQRLPDAQSGLAMTPGISLRHARPGHTAERHRHLAGTDRRPNCSGSTRRRSLHLHPECMAMRAWATIRGPGFVIWDSSLSKHIPGSEKSQFRFSAEFFNYLNHTNWSGVSTALGIRHLWTNHQRARSATCAARSAL